MKFVFSSLFVLLFHSFIIGQTNNDSLIINKDSLNIATIDSNSIEQKSKLKRFFSDNYPSPKKALLLSLVLPGAGQVYNKKGWWWRVPVIYGGLGFGVYLIDHNQSQYAYYRDIYKIKVDPNSTETDPLPLLSSTSTKFRRDAYDKRLQQSWFFTVIWYVLNGVDAFVNAHLLNFDIDDNISLQIRPGNSPTLLQQTNIGLGLNLSIKAKPNQHKIVLPFY